MFLLFYCEDFLSINLWVSGNFTAVNITSSVKWHWRWYTQYAAYLKHNINKNLSKLKILNFIVLLINRKNDHFCGALFIMMYKYVNVALYRSCFLKVSFKFPCIDAMKILNSLEWKLLHLSWRDWIVQ